MCYGNQRLPWTDDFAVNSTTRPLRRNLTESEAVVEDLRDRLAETESRLERARAREEELSRQLEEMKRFVSVMEIIETYLRRRFREQQDQLLRLYSSIYQPFCLGCTEKYPFHGRDKVLLLSVRGEYNPDETTLKSLLSFINYHWKVTLYSLEPLRGIIFKSTLPKH